MTTRAAVTINSREDREKVARWAEKVPEGTIVEFRKKTRSHEQNAKMHAMLAEVSEQVDWYGSKLDPEDWKTMFTASLRKANVIPGIDAGTVVPLGLSTSAMTVDEMSNLIELIYAFGADPAHPVTFREPQEDNQNTDERGPANEASSVADEVPPPSSQEDGGEVSPPSASSPSSSLSAETRQHLMDFARKGLRTLGEDLDNAGKLSAIDDMIANYRDAIPEADWSKLSTIKVAIQAVLAGKRTIDQARSFVATDLLECAVAEIGG
ncbi:MAG: recombination protein NinB [Proteobacteria bacterium]|nr:recombination protein NinB [Pseudomonadota bacterium]